MINHARTLLLNLAGSTSQRDDTGEEYIPPRYAPIALPSYLQTARRVLFGAAPDRYFINFRARELMAHLHETELAEYVYALDSRVTYWPEPALPFYTTEKQVKATQFFGQSAVAPFFRGDLFADNARGRSVREFTLRVVPDNGSWLAQLQPHEHKAALETTALTFTSGLSQAVELSNTGLQVQLSQPVAAAWEIYTRVRPLPALTTLMPLLEMLGEPLLLELFGVSAARPYDTFKQLWADHPNPIYRLGGLTLALIYRTDEARRT